MQLSEARKQLIADYPLTIAAWHPTYTTRDGKYTPMWLLKDLAATERHRAECYPEFTRAEWDRVQADELFDDAGEPIRPDVMDALEFGEPS